MKKSKFSKLNISNIVANGKFSFKRKLNYEEMEKLISKSHFGWGIVNQETTPQLCTYIVREDKSKIYIGLWHTGSFIMTGIRSEKEVKIYFYEILKELKKIVPKVFENNGGKK
ncbi:MAG TPA: hypothetical protein VMV95_00145 [Bacillota bacterium]|nr:hypothetical protein [Bacillota bacterium]